MNMLSEQEYLNSSFMAAKLELCKLQSKYFNSAVAA
jgi:hypothetical protein